MNLENILLGRAVRLINVSSVAGGTLYGVNLTRALESRYGFLEGPRTLNDYDFSKGITFQHGYFRGHVIDKFQIYAEGVLVEAKLNTDTSEAFIDDALKWVQEEAGVKVADKVGSPRFFASNLEVSSAISLPRQLKAISDFGSEISKILRSYGQTPPDHELSGLSFSMPLGQPSLWQPPSFKFERREASPEQSKLYYSLSSMRTDDHLKALSILEAMLMSGAAAS